MRTIPATNPKIFLSTVPVSNLSKLKDPNLWQPLTYLNGKLVIMQEFVGASVVQGHSLCHEVARPEPAIPVGFRSSARRVV